MRNEKNLFPYTDGFVFTTNKQGFAALRHPKYRSGLEITAADFTYLPYHVEKPTANDRRRTVEKAQETLTEAKNENLQSFSTSVEEEGVLVGQDGHLRNVHNENIGFDRAPAERFTAQLEVVTGKTPEGTFPSDPIEIAHALAEAVIRGVAIANERNGLFVMTGAPESGDSSQIELTDDPKIREAYARGQTGIHPNTPEEVKNLCQILGISDIIPFSGMHVHTGNFQFEEGVYDPRDAFAAGILELTQLSQVETFILFNSCDILGQRFPWMRDARSYLRRTTEGAHDTPEPLNAYQFIQATRDAVEKGKTHDLSRAFGPHDRLRMMKDFGTMEGVAGVAISDLRFALGYIFSKQLNRPLSRQALAVTEGHEEQTLTYLRKKYPQNEYLFSVIPTMQGDMSCYTQDMLFNGGGFYVGPKAMKPYKEQIDDIRLLRLQIGADFPAFQTQALIVDHVFRMATQPLPKGMQLDRFMDIESGLKGGLVVDAKRNASILKNQYMQAEGTRKQAERLLQVQTNQDLLEFVGLTGAKAKTVYSRKE